MEPSGRDRFLACDECGVLQPLVDRRDPRTDEAIKSAIDDVIQFLDDHRTHQLTECCRSSPDLAGDGPLWDPMTTLNFEVTDGHTTYVVTASRPSIDEPRTYVFVPGALKVQSSEVGIDDDDIRRGLDMEFHPHALRSTKLDRFVSALQEVISHINPENLPIVFDAAEDPAVSVARMPDELYEELLNHCVEIFDPWELRRVSNFLRDNREADGLLALRVRRHLGILTA